MHLLFPHCIPQPSDLGFIQILRTYIKLIVNIYQANLHQANHEYPRRLSDVMAAPLVQPLGVRSILLRVTGFRRHPLVFLVLQVLRFLFISSMPSMDSIPESSLLPIPLLVNDPSLAFTIPIRSYPKAVAGTETFSRRSSPICKRDASTFKLQASQKKCVVATHGIRNLTKKNREFMKFISNHTIHLIRLQHQGVWNFFILYPPVLCPE